MWSIFKHAFGLPGEKEETNPQTLAQTPYYHFFVPREEVEELLEKPGDFLVRAMMSEGAKIALVLSARGVTKVEHFMAEFKTHEGGKFYFVKDVGKPTVPELVEFHYKRKIPVHNFYLRRPIGRASHEVLSYRLKFDPTKILGEGNFAVVTRGQLNLSTAPNGSEWVDVAIKRIRIEKCKTPFQKLDTKHQIVRELQIGRVLRGHPHVVTVYGILIENDDIAVMSELCTGGGLDSYLHKNEGNVSVLEKLNFLYHAADGLAFMHHNGLIHRDMAARNLLLVKREAEGLIPQVKVTDFGLTRSGPTYKMSSPEEFPFIICAPESLADDAIWTYRSEVWSFGVLIWEVYNDAKAEPYALEAANLDGNTLNQFLKEGKRLAPHPSMAPEIVALMSECFLEDSKRPEMKQIRQRIFDVLKKVCLETTGYAKEIKESKETKEASRGSTKTALLTKSTLSKRHG